MVSSTNHLLWLSMVINQLLHGEQYLELIRPIPTSGRVHCFIYTDISPGQHLMLLLAKYYHHLFSRYYLYTSCLGTLHSKATIVDIMDKGKGANILCDGKVILTMLRVILIAHVIVVTTDENDQVICKNQFSTFVVGMTGFGGKNKSSHVKVCALTRTTTYRAIFLASCSYS